MGTLLTPSQSAALKWCRENRRSDGLVQLRGKIEAAARLGFSQHDLRALAKKEYLVREDRFCSRRIVVYRPGPLFDNPLD